MESSEIILLLLFLGKFEMPLFCVLFSLILFVNRFETSIVCFPSPFVVRPSWLISCNADCDHKKFRITRGKLCKTTEEGAARFITVWKEGRKLLHNLHRRYTASKAQPRARYLPMAGHFSSFSKGLLYSVEQGEPEEVQILPPINHPGNSSASRKFFLVQWQASLFSPPQKSRPPFLPLPSFFLWLRSGGLTSPEDRENDYLFHLGSTSQTLFHRTIKKIPMQCSCSYKYRGALKGSSQVEWICGGKIVQAIGKQNATFSFNFTQPGKSLLVQPCSSHFFCSCYFLREWSNRFVHGNATDIRYAVGR